MFLIGFVGCEDCDQAKSAYPDAEYVMLGVPKDFDGAENDDDSQRKKVLAAKKALHALGHDGKFPCLLNDDMTELKLRGEVMNAIKPPKPVLRFRKKNTVPPGGMYFFRVPETGFSIEKATMMNLLNGLRAHYVSNNMSIPENLEELVEDQMCQKLPESFCRGEAVRSGRAIRRNDITLVSRLITEQRGDVFVDGTEMYKRASICIDCPSHVKNFCTSCNGLGDFRKKALPQISVPNESNLHLCAGTSALIPVLIPYQVDVIKRVCKGSKLPEGCWINSEIDHE